MKKSLKTKFVVMTFICALLVAISMGAVSLISSRNIVDKNSKSIITLTASKNAQSINTMMTSIEQSVKIAHSYAVNMFTSAEDYRYDPELLEEYVYEIELLLKNAAENTPGAISTYIRFAPEHKLPLDGCLLVYNENGDPNIEEENTEISEDDESENSVQAPKPVPGFYDHPMTDISDLQVKKETMWYFSPKMSSEPQWIDPYIDPNRAEDTQMISYVMPIIKNGGFIGVIGMDIRMELVISAIDSIHAYDTGFAYLCNEKAELIYHKNFPKGVSNENFRSFFGVDRETLLNARSEDILIAPTSNGKEKMLSAQRLANDMIFVLTIPRDEIEADRNILMTQISLVLFITLGISFIITMETVTFLFKPIKHLTEVSKQIASGDLDVEIVCKSKDEIGTLANSFRTTVGELKRFIAKINKQAFTDAATGAGNKAAYAEAIKRAEIIAKHPGSGYAVIVMDINYLKMYNDRHGHEFGDMLISDASDIIHSIFDEYEIFRIGGDEFVCIILNPEKGVCEKLKTNFKAAVAKFNEGSTRYELGLHVAIGYSEFGGTDTHETFTDVFARADKDMYYDKLEIKKNVKTPEGYVDDRTVK
jgi:diguanylate cyclase (GGDEF)-like protein